MNIPEKNASIDDGYTPVSQRPETYIVPVLFLIIFVVGVLGNGTLVVIFMKHRAMRNVPNTFILSLALADLLLLVTCIPFTGLIYTTEGWPWGMGVCKLSETTKTISVGVSVFTLTALSAERYCAIANPLRRLQTKPMTVLSAILIWLVAVVFSLPDCIYANVQPMGIVGNRTIFVCTPYPISLNGTMYTKYNVTAKALVYYIIPLIVIGAFYVLMAKKLHASANEMPGELPGAQSVAQANARRHVARMVLVFVFLFFICFLPQHFFLMWFHWNPKATDEYDDTWHTLKIIGFCLSFLNSCVNPVALYLVSGVFRQHFNRHLCCQNQRRLNRNLPSGSNCETSFNSTYRRHTQGTMIEPHSLYRKNTLARQITQDTTLLTLDTSNKKDINGMRFGS